ncbi:MAG: phosphoribosylformylglycinamidine cyclo-ligase [Candidatus Marinimicrobia bacterium]|nr:phosphoribosylformylglycinamidine cyclo-ligase [Candidatus Neomarinimicrobiota bacterium]
MAKKNTRVDYKSAGVNIDAGNEAVERIKAAVHSTYTPAVLSELGGFGSFFDLSQITKDYINPVMVQSVDGVGTKIIIARLMNKYDTIGHDLVSACANDILVHGARPLTFLDYIANDRLHPEVVEDIVSGIAAACRETGIALVGGETAEMPDTYLPGENDLVGIVTGVVERNKIINGSAIEPGDVLIGIESSGLHTNGYSLARKLFFEIGKFNVNSHPDDLDSTVGETLLEPHINYTNLVMSLVSSNCNIHGVAHITGGGFIDNIPRILPKICAAEIQLGSWKMQPVFPLMQELGNLGSTEMYRTFNMGIGLVLVVPEVEIESLLSSIGKSGYQAWRLGGIIPGHRQIHLI